MSMVGKLVIVATVLGMLLLTGASGATATSAIPPSGFGDQSLVQDSEEDEQAKEEDDDGGWFSKLVDAGGDVVTGTKDAVVDGANEVWDVTERAPGIIWETVQPLPGVVWDAVQATPGVIWDIIRGTPGALADAGSAIWGLLRTSFELGAWAEFLERHWLLGAILGPVVAILIGLSPDGTISILEIGIGLITLIIPGGKGVQIVSKRVDDLAPATDDAVRIVTGARRHPSGVLDGVSMMYRYSRAKVIAPTADGFAQLPQASGVYIARNAAGEPIYVGMSTWLPNRVPQHFSRYGSPFADSTSSLKIMPTSSVPEARALECSLIKTFMPEYNIVHRNANACPMYLLPTGLVP